MQKTNDFEKIKRHKNVNMFGSITPTGLSSRSDICSNFKEQQYYNVLAENEVLSDTDFYSLSEEETIPPPPPIYSVVHKKNGKSSEQ